MCVSRDSFFMILKTHFCVGRVKVKKTHCMYLFTTVWDPVWDPLRGFSLCHKQWLPPWAATHVSWEHFPMSPPPHLQQWLSLSLSLSLSPPNPLSLSLSLSFVTSTTTLPPSPLLYSQPCWTTNKYCGREICSDLPGRSTDRLAATWPYSSALWRTHHFVHKQRI